MASTIRKTRAVRWSLEELPANEAGNVTLTAMPVEAGEHKVLIEGKAEQGLTAKQEAVIAVEGVAAILFQVMDVEDPIEVNGETTYEIQVVNQGSKAATDVQLEAVLPPQMRPLSAEGPVRHDIANGTVLFDKLPRLAPKADTTYRVKAKGLAPGDMRVRVRVNDRRDHHARSSRKKAPASTPTSSPQRSMVVSFAPPPLP